MAQPKQTDPQFKLRLTPELKNKIETAAASGNRSMNAEIVARLEDSFRGGINPEELTVALYGMAVFARDSGMVSLDDLIAEIQRRMK